MPSPDAALPVTLDRACLRPPPFSVGGKYARLVMRPQPPVSPVVAMSLSCNGPRRYPPRIQGLAGVNALEGHSRETAEAHGIVSDTDPNCRGVVIFLRSALEEYGRVGYSVNVILRSALLVDGGVVPSQSKSPFLSGWGFCFLCNIAPATG